MSHRRPSAVLFGLAGLLVVALLVVWGVRSWRAAPEAKITVYFATSDGYLAPVQLAVPKTKATALGALETLLSGPPTQVRLISPVPPNTRLLGFRLDGRTADVTLSDEFIGEAAGGTAGDELRVLSVVDTLTEWPNVQAVRIRVGERKAPLSSHIDFSQPIQRDLSLVRPVRG